MSLPPAPQGAAAPLHYQWRRNGVDIASANKAWVTIDRALSGDDGAHYSVRVSNAAGSMESKAAVLGVVDAAIELPWR